MTAHRSSEPPNSTPTGHLCHEVNEFVEHMEHAAHASHEGHGGSKNLGKYIGITMALLGVMLALCAALVGRVGPLAETDSGPSGGPCLSSGERTVCQRRVLRPGAPDRPRQATAPAPGLSCGAGR